MESGWRYARFFFQDAVKRAGSVLEHARKRYPDLFNGDKNGRRNTPQASYRYIVGRNVADRHNQLCSLCDYDPDKIMKMEKIPIIDFYMILNSRVETARKSKKK